MAPSAERAVLETLVESHRSFLHFLERRLGDRAVAEDILQDAFVRSIEKNGELRDEGSAVAWFYRMLRNAVIDHHRRSGTKDRALGLLAREMADAAEPPVEIRGAICRCISQLAGGLKKEYVEALEEIEIGEKPLREFAAERGITPNNASQRLFRAREALRRQVVASCRTCAEHGCLDCSCTPSASAHP
jgi:RNA polymerase sigma factor (sigma-70 family)